MTVPFDRIGPGQIGRYVYQVIGKDGPIYNPSNIRYLGPSESPGTPIFSPLSALTGLAGLNLAASVGNLAVSAILLHEVRQVERQLAVVGDKLDGMAVTLSDVQQRVTRIDTRVSESHLREALRHCVSRSIDGEGINLKAFVPLLDDISNVEETLEAGLVFNFGIRLSSDLRDHLQSLLSLLSGVRRSIVCLHNQAIAFSPERLIHYSEYGDYFLPGTLFDTVQFAILAGRTDIVFNRFAEVLGEAVHGHFTFANDNDREHFRQLVVEECYNPQMAAWHEIPTASMGLKLSCVLDGLELNYEDDEAPSVATNVCSLWISEADASLLFRLKAELTGIRDGYAKTFYLEQIDEPDVPLVAPVFALGKVSA